MYLPENTADVAELDNGSDFFYRVYYDDETECGTNTALKDKFIDSIEHIVVDGDLGIYYFQ